MSESVVDVLRRAAPAFAGAAESTLAVLAQAARPEALARGATFFTQGDPGDVCYVVQSGRIAIVLLSPDGRELTVETLGPGEVFGELGVLTGRARAPARAGRDAHDAGRAAGSRTPRRVAMLTRA